jgi:hypothetical protein
MSTKKRDDDLKMAQDNYNYVKHLITANAENKNLTDVLLKIKTDRQIDELMTRLVKTNNALIHALEIKPLIKVKK